MVNKVTHDTNSFKTFMDGFSVHPALRRSPTDAESRDAVMLLCLLLGIEVTSWDLVHRPAQFSFAEEQ